MRENVCGVCDVNITRGKMFSFIYTVVLVVQEKKRKENVAAYVYAGFQAESRFEGEKKTSSEIHRPKQLRQREKECYMQRFLNCYRCVIAERFYNHC
jgi:hypothetical protein